MSAAACLGNVTRHAAAHAAHNVAIYRTAEELTAILPKWSALYRSSGVRNPFVSPEWVTACFDSVARSSTPFVVAWEREGELRGVAPLRLDRQFGFRVLRPAGSGWSPYSGFLVHPEDPDAEWELLGALASRGSDWDLLLVTQLAEPISRLHLLAAAPSGVQCLIEPAPWPGSAILARDVQWEILLVEGPGWLKRMAKALRKFERDGGSVTRFTGAEASAQREAIEAVETVSWQGQHGQTANPSKRRAVMRLVQRALAQCAESELWLAVKDGKPIAYEVNFRPPGRLWMYRGAYDPAFARWSPSGVLDFVSIREAWLAGHREYDMMSGGETYKLECTDSLRDLKQMTLVPKTARGTLAYACLRAPKQFAESHPIGKRLVRTAARALRSPRAFLPGNAAAARRAH